MLVQIHLIQNHAPSNLNRDDTGSPKDALFGGVGRARISSQCLKRSIRQSAIFRDSMAEHLGTRTRRLPQQVRMALVAQGVTESIADEIAAKATAIGSDKESMDGTTRQLIFLGAGEVDALAAGLYRLWQSDAKGFNKMNAEAIEKALRDEGAATLPCSVDIALFGRMTTSALFEDVQAAAQVAHAISTTRLDQQFDYFTAVDDLKTDAEDDHGAGMIGDVAFNSATYYKYFTIDRSALVSRLGDDAQIADDAICAFLRAAVLTTPSGKQNSFAAHNPPDAILVEVSQSHVPVSYANAFVTPIRASRERDVVAISVDRLSQYRSDLNSAYGLQRESFALTPRSDLTIAEATSVPDLESLCVAMRAVLSGAQEG